MEVRNQAFISAAEVKLHFNGELTATVEVELCPKLNALLAFEIYILAKCVYL